MGRDRRCRSLRLRRGPYGSFTRSFTLPDDADAAKVTAEFKDGLLTVRLAKSEHALPKAVEVKFS